MGDLTTGNCLYCGQYSANLLARFCSPVCDSKHGIYGSTSKEQKFKCQECKKEFVKNRNDQRFCTPLCRSREYNRFMKHKKSCTRSECTICQSTLDHRPYLGQKNKFKGPDLFS